MALHSLYAHLWSIADRGVECFADDLQRAGLGACSYAATYHAVRQLMPGNPRRAIFHCPRSHAYFRPRGHYGRLAPLPSPLLRPGAGLEAVCAALGRRGLRVKAWVVGGHNSDLAGACPDCAVQGPLGDPHPHHLCPAHPEVAAYLEALAVDLAAHHELAALELESFCYPERFEHGAHHEMSGVPADPWHSRLLSLCFCPWCRPPAGLRAAVAAELRAWLATPAWELASRPSHAVRDAAAAFAAAHPELDALLAGQRRTVAELGARLRAAVRRVAPSTALIDLGGGSAAPSSELGAWADGLVVRADPVAVRAARDILGAAMDVGVGLYMLAPTPLTPTQLRETVCACAAAGAVSFNYYNHGLMPEAAWHDIAGAARANP